YFFKRINAERNITPETYYAQSKLDEAGKGSTNLIWKYLNFTGYDQNVIKKKFMKALNTIVNPDMGFTDIMMKEDDKDSNRTSAIGEIYFETNKAGWVPLSKMGSGIKTIIQVLLNLIVIPISEHISESKFIFGFEELENNLHPSLQRRLFRYIYDYQKEHEAIFFVTTHSNVVIDLFINNDDAQIIYVKNDGDETIAIPIKNISVGSNLLKDLGFKASDLLLANGIVWVEGPSDAIYLELWIRMYLKKITHESALSFSIQSLATALWKYAGFVDFDWAKIDSDLENKIINLAKINPNHLLIIDRDDDYKDLKPSEFESFNKGNGKNKARLINESMKF
ncbi:MAG TPA: AAA family ATPase, partial [Aquella sp.]|nr:AAA family ATPase [Aquella sp.]